MLKYYLNEAAAGLDLCLNPHKYCRFSKGLQVSTNQISSDLPLERAQRLLPFIFKKAPHRWLLSNELPVTLNTCCRARKYTRQMISNKESGVFAKSWDFSFNKSKYLNIGRIFQFSSEHTCFGMHILIFAHSEKINTCLNIPSREGLVPWSIKHIAVNTSEHL